MKSSLRLLLLSASLAFATQVIAADRWSSDEMAVRMGVNTWLTFWTRPTATAGDPGARGLYATQPSASLPAVVQTASQANALPRVSQPDRVSVRMQGDRATTAFELDPAQQSRVVLTWERRSGLWRIVQETITPASEAAERVALSEPARK